MFSGVGDQSLTQVQQRSSSAGQEMWPCGGNDIFFPNILLLLGNYGLDLTH